MNEIYYFGFSFVADCIYGGDIQIDYDEYVSIRKLGDGASGKTCLAKKIDSGEYKAIKVKSLSNVWLPYYRLLATVYL